MKHKILFVQTNYPGFLEEFYKKHPKLSKLSYAQIHASWADEMFGSGNFYSANLKKFGWVANEVIINDWTQQSRWAKENSFNASNTEPQILKWLPESIKYRFGLKGWVKEVLFAQVKKYEPDVIYIHDLWVLNEKDLLYLKNQGCLVVGQIASAMPTDSLALKAYDLIISSFPHYVRRFQELGIQSEYLRWCVDKKVLENTKKTPRDIDTMFVGSFSLNHSSGYKIFEKLAKKVRVDFWGFGGSSLPSNSVIRNTYHGNAYGKYMYELFSKAKIVVNRHINQSKNYANNMRMFEATAMGALLITDYKSNINEFFVSGKEVVVYKNIDELVSKIKYYLSHTKEREKIAKAGQKRTLKDHTYQVRMKELDKILKKYL